MESIMRVIFIGQKEMVILVLLNHGADINSKNSSGYTALHLSSQNGHLSVVECLIKYGADLYTKNQYGEIPVELARKHKKIIVFQFLNRIQQENGIRKT